VVAPLHIGLKKTVLERRYTSAARKTPATSDRPGAWPTAEKELMTCSTLSGVHSNG